MAEEEVLLEELNNDHSKPLLTITQVNQENNLEEFNGDVCSSGEEPVKRNSNSELEWDSTQDYVESSISMENLSIQHTDSVFSSEEGENRSCSPVSVDENVTDEGSTAYSYKDNGVEPDCNVMNIDSMENNDTDVSKKLENVGDVFQSANIPEHIETPNYKDESGSVLDIKLESSSAALDDSSLHPSSRISGPLEYAAERILLDGQSKDDTMNDVQIQVEDSLSCTSSPVPSSNASVNKLEEDLKNDNCTEFLDTEEVNQIIQHTVERTNQKEENSNKKYNNNKSIEKSIDTISNNGDNDVQRDCLESTKTNENHSVASSDVSQSQYCIDNDAAESLLSELEDLLSSDSSEVELPNGLRKEAIDIQEMSEFKRLTVEVEQLRKSCEEKDHEIKRLQINQDLDTSEQHEGSGDHSHQLIKELQSLKDAHIQKIKELEAVVEQQKKELHSSKERQQSHDAAAKRTILKLQQEMATHIEQLKKKYEETLKEKETMVIKYARSEKEVMEQQKAKEGFERKVKETTKTIESLTSQLKQLKSDRAKLKGMLETKESDITSLQKDVEQLKEEASSQGIKVKWAQNKLKTELDAHRETKGKLSKTEQKLSEAKEETEQIRRNCQEIIKTYQESEEMKSNSLDAELKRKQVELQEHLQEKTDRDEVHIAKTRELECLKKTYADCLAELDSLKVKSKCLEDERIQNEKLMDSLKAIINSQKEENCKLNRQVEEIISLQELLEDERETITKLGAEVKTLHSNNMDLNSDMCTMRQKEADLLRFTEKITGKNADLHSENSTLQEKVEQQSIDLEKLSKELQELRQTNDKLSADLKLLQQFHEEESELLRTKVNEKSKAVEQLTIQLDDARDDNKTLKRKHVANVKDITRQLQQARKRLEALENPENGHKDTISIGSRTSSNGSLDTLPSASSTAVSTLDGDVQRRTESPTQPQERPTGGTNDFPGVNKAMLVDKIIRLQKTLHKKKEKMDFMQDHMNQLVEELQKKSKIIQMYVLREESGALAPVASDVHKAKLSKQGGIMASLYKSQQADPSMTLELSLEINRKLQAVLEDTLLKNITLKESIETLGNEIARITSHEMDRSRGGRPVKKT